MNLPRLAILLFGLLTISIRTAELPRVTVGNIRRVFYNGEHNAFTDFCRERGSF